MNKHVLIVDDEEEIIDFMENFLKRFKISSTKVTSGEEALTEYDRRVPDFVLLDIHLKGIDGFTVLRELKAKDPAAKVIIITGSSEKDSQERARSMGALDYICKPLDLGELKDKITRYML